MIQIKIFDGDGSYGVERNVNEWLERKEYKEIISIKFSTCCDNWDVNYTVMIQYIK